MDNRFALENKGITTQYTMVHERLISLGTDHKKTWGGEGRSTKTIFAQGEITWKKIHARQLILKNIHAMG